MSENKFERYKLDFSKEGIKKSKTFRISTGFKNLDRLIGALNDIKRIYSKDKTGMLDHEYINPIVRLSPQDAFYGNKRSVPIEESSGRISGEFVMCYPPGIPILAPGEQITDEILAYIKYAGDKGCFLTGTQDLEIKNIMILDD